MAETFVALDLETTGTNPKQDAVIEIGAVRFSLRRVEDTWSTLVNPGRPIPEQIQALTGISNEMVRSAPRLKQVLEELADFVGDAILVGHNIGFDLGFFESYETFAYNLALDTYELATVLLPSASRYSLGALSQLLSIPLPPGEEYHRALTDARVTQALFLRLFEHARSLPLETVAEIVRLGQDVDWNSGWVFEQVLRERVRQETLPGRRAYGPYPAFWFEGNDKATPLPPPKENVRPLDAEEVAGLLQHGGPFARYFPAFEHRPEQVEMARAVAQALSEGRHLMVEAGTGVGKSFAYLLPAALFALENNTRVLISTNTINLQEQLLKKDIPDLRAALGLDGLRTAVLKGRANYLCPRRFDLLRQQGARNADEMRLLAKVLIWLLENPNGDRGELNLHSQGERDTWVRVSAEDDRCTAETCLTRYGGGCPFYRARQAALSAHLLVVNHALLLSDVATGSRVLPEYAHLIVDEAHHLEGATTNALTMRLTRAEMERMLRELGGVNAGLLGRLLTEVKSALRPSEWATLQAQINHATDLAFRFQEYLQRFFQSLEQFVQAQRASQPESNYAWQMRVTASTRSLPLWDRVEIAWDAAGEAVRLLINHLSTVYKDLGAFVLDAGLESAADTLGEIGNLLRRLSEAEAHLTSLVSKPEAHLVYWLEAKVNGGQITLNAAPLQIGPMLEKYLWHEKSSIVLTSATLTAHGSFGYLRNTLNADEADELILGSPFDYENSTLLFIPNDIAEPHTPAYQSQVERALIQSCIATGGRTLALFTSYSQLRRTAQAIAGPLARHGIAVYEQGEGASPSTLLESFKASDRAVLLGTRSFWEGVDIPGQALSVVFIVKLPFDVPNDPIIEARSEMYENAFEEYYLPEAILKFRQGFGRLIRTASDRGVVAILDRRVLSKRYGRLFLESLPPCTARQGPLAALPRLAAQWLG